MLEHKKESIEKHIKTHSIRSVEDNSAVTTLENFLKSDGRINTNFSKNDKWPNTDGTFEFVIDPDTSRRPMKNFFIQIKGTHQYTEKDGVLKYSLKSLAFPAFISLNVTSDPGVLFVVLEPDCRGQERVFWKYMSVDFLNSINFDNDSTTISFSANDEILNTDESIKSFCDKLESIVEHHSFVNKLSSSDYSKNDIEKIISVCNEEITESIDRMDVLNANRDNISRRILLRLTDLCEATLLMNVLKNGYKTANIRLAWERAILDINTKYLGTFLKGLKYIGNRIPESGQSERLMLKYYNFLWQIRRFLLENYNISILCNLEKFLPKPDELDNEYYELVATAINSVDRTPKKLGLSRFYIQKKTPFFVGTERYYEITLQLCDVYATKYNRITAYTKDNISTNYSIQISYEDAMIDLWGINSNIKVITNWKVSIKPSCLNKLAKILRIKTNLNSRYSEYVNLMNFLTKTGINFLDLIDLQELDFLKIMDSIFNTANTSMFKDVFLKLKENFSTTSDECGRNVVRYLLLNLREETLERVLPNGYFQRAISSEKLYLSTRCIPFERNPFISNLVGSKTSESNLIKIVNVAGIKKMETVLPYLSIKKEIIQTGEIYFDANTIATEEEINNYNNQLDSWEKNNGYNINFSDGIVSIDSYEKSTICILKKLLEFSKSENKGQKELNKKFLIDSKINFTDPLKKRTIRDVFANSRILLIYGAAGTGKTTLINYISNLMGNRKKLFLSKTHTAKQNLQRRIENPGTSAEFVSIDSFSKKISLQEYDIIFIDECSTIDNRTMMAFFNKVNPDTFLVFAGDIHQIESIDFGNWFYYAKDIINTPGANVELLDTWRTNDSNLISLWNEVRAKEDILITEKLAMDGPFSENIGSDIFITADKDEVILCLNYDGKFGLNNINNYFQNANTSANAIIWKEWSYKEGDPILFNDTLRFSVLYNNLKGKIVKIEKENDHITFTIDVDMILTEKDCNADKIEFIDIIEDSTRIRFSVYDYDEEELNEDLRMKTVIPFQLAYAVSIHKAQGLEYNSVKVIIPSNNSEKITHEIFYTAITRAKKKLKIYWSSETMQEVIKSFSVDKSKRKSLEIVKSKLLNDR